MVVGISLLGKSKEEEPTSVLKLESPSGNSKYLKNAFIIPKFRKEMFSFLHKPRKYLYNKKYT